MQLYTTELRGSVRNTAANDSLTVKYVGANEKMCQIAQKTKRRHDWKNHENEKKACTIAILGVC